MQMLRCVYRCRSLFSTLNKNIVMADKQEKDGLYKASALKTPTISELTEIANELGLHCTDGEFEHLQEHMSAIIESSYQIVNDLVTPTLPVKYPRTPGYRPEPEDNKCNAWYWKCDIAGAPDGILKGKSVGIKDNVCVAGIPMMNGSKIMEGFVPDIDATVVTRILDAGGRIVGKTNCEHLCFSGSSWTNDTGPTLNPLDKSRSAGGSSSGSAVAVIAGFDDGRDPRQPKCLEVPKYSKLLDGKLDAWKIGLVTEGFTGCDNDVQSVVREAAQQLCKAGAQVEDVSVPMHTHGLAIVLSICTDGGYQCMVRGSGAGYHYKGYYAEPMMKNLFSGYKTEAKQLSENMKYLCLFGKYIEKNYGNRFYGRAQNLNMQLTKAYDEALANYDVIIMPTLPYKAPHLPTKHSSYQERLLNANGMLKNTAPFDCTGHPAVSINAGKSQGLPIGMMIVGKQFEDTKVLQAAFAFEQLQKK